MKICPRAERVTKVTMQNAATECVYAFAVHGKQFRDNFLGCAESLKVPKPVW